MPGAIKSYRALLLFSGLIVLVSTLRIAILRDILSLTMAAVRSQFTLSRAAAPSVSLSTGSKASMATLASFQIPKVDNEPNVSFERFFKRKPLHADQQFRNTMLRAPPTARSSRRL